MIVSQNGLNWADSLKYGRTDGVIDTMALGTGTVAEDPTNTLADMDIVYQTDEVAETKFIERDSATTECAIDINVGQQVPVGTVLTEIAAIITKPNGDEILFARDTFGAVTLDQGSSGRSFERYFQISTQG